MIFILVIPPDPPLLMFYVRDDEAWCRNILILLNDLHYDQQEQQ